MKSRIAFSAGESRTRNMENVLSLIEDDIDLSDRSDVFIKVNFVDTEIEAAVTHADSVRVLLEFLRRRYDGKISIGESTMQGPVEQAFEHFGYMDILRKHAVNIVDMKEGDWDSIRLYDSGLKPMDIHYSRQMLKSDYLISIGPPKTHDAVTVTLSIKNIVMGGVSHRHDDKHKMHQGPQAMNLDLYLAAIEHIPELAVIDGFVAMEGDGPVHGDPFEWKIAAASCDAVAADCFISGLMGFDYKGIGYLSYLVRMGFGNGDPEMIELLGDNPEVHRRRFKPHSLYEWQKTWPDERVNRLLEIRRNSG